MCNDLLVIEDADLHLSILCKIAQQAGFTATGAHSVAEAARFVRERTFDCITLDLSLGEQSGVEILKLLAEIGCRTPIIIISASDDEARALTRHVGSLLNLNLRQPIPKPINLAALRRTLTCIAEETSKQKLAAPAG
ncbi:MAG: response regulator [Bradyrhizobium sp.]|uniref:response regulator n=1 Tax=Bradyrhizobium sp. TaxID=376 RepID=UPI001D9002DB|nr:response regulator [Bradyrhizobium sp.]MBV9559504.1 response regulator [Bradyrhizobium sp.]